MTRETKIGLLVGLAFIIVIGILLSDHLTSTTEPPQARLTQAGSNVRQAVSVPGAATANPPVTTVVAPDPVTPQQPIPTRDELTPKPQPVQIVQVGPSTTGGQEQQPHHHHNHHAATGTTPPVTAAPDVQAPAQMIAQHAPTPQQQAPSPESPQQLPLENPIVPQQPVAEASNTAQQQQQPAAPADLAQVAKQIGEEIVGLTTPPPTPASTPPANNPSAAAPALDGGKPYKAQQGDTLSKLAGRFLGANTKANRDAIIKANPSLQKNPDIIVVGKTYIIPTNGTATATAATPAAPAVTTATPSASPEYWYTVKENDSLRKIALNQLGNEDAWAAIQDLNKATLKGEDKTVVVPGMKLKLPAKPVASAS